MLKDTKRIHLEIEKITKSEEKAKMLLKLFEEDCKNWQTQYTKSLSLIKSYKLDALLTSAFVSYIGIFDLNMRDIVMSKWIACLKKLSKDKSAPPSTSHTTPNHHPNHPNHHHHHHMSVPTKFELRTPIQEEIDSRTNITSSVSIAGVGGVGGPDSGNDSAANRYILRDDYDFKSIVINPHDNKDTLVQLNRLALKDRHFINSALLLREFCVLPNVLNWPVVFDPENISIKV